MFDFSVPANGHFPSGSADSGSPCPITVPILTTYLTDRLPAFVTVTDASLDTIALLRVLHAINRHWASLYDVSTLESGILLSGMVWLFVSFPRAGLSGLELCALFPPWCLRAHLRAVSTRNQLCSFVRVAFCVFSVGGKDFLTT